MSRDQEAEPMAAAAEDDTPPEPILASYDGSVEVLQVNDPEDPGYGSVLALDYDKVGHNLYDERTNL